MGGCLAWLQVLGGFLVLFNAQYVMLSGSLLRSNTDSGAGGADSGKFPTKHSPHVSAHRAPGLMVYSRRTTKRFSLPIAPL